ncbi:hypothetical protein D046_8351, partial [Vibrio parahaemolyticus V-223/04]
ELHHIIAVLDFQRATRNIVESVYCTKQAGFARTRQTHQYTDFSTLDR